MRVPKVWVASRLAYVGLVAVLAARWSGPHAVGGFSIAEAATFLVTAPVSVVSLPVTYLVLAAAWNITGADNGGPVWPLTLACTAWFTVLAVANMVFLTAAARQVRRCRLRAARATASGDPPTADGGPFTARGQPDAPDPVARGRLGQHPLTGGQQEPPQLGVLAEFGQVGSDDYAEAPLSPALVIEPANLTAQSLRRARMRRQHACTRLSATSATESPPRAGHPQLPR